MKRFLLFAAFAVLLFSCIDRTDIKNEIASYHACVTKCEDLENTITFNYYKCNQNCLDNYDAKLKICNTLEPAIREKGKLEIEEARNQCIEACQEKVMTVKAELKEQIRKCKDICIYHLKK